MADVITNDGRNAFLNRIFKGTPDNSEPTYFVLSTSSTTPTTATTSLAGRIGKTQTTIDAADATTGWTQSGDGDAVVLNTTAGEFREGTGCLNIPSTFSTGTSAWEKTVTSADVTDDYVAFLFYVDDKTNLTAGTNTLVLFLGTGGFTNANQYHTSKTNLVNGWNRIIFKVSSYTSQDGTGLDETNLDSVKIQVKTSASYTGNSMRFDFINYFTETESLISFTSGYPVFDSGLITAQIRGTVEATEMNDGTPELSKFGVYNNDSSKVLISAHNFSSDVNKTNKTRLTIIETTGGSA